MKPIPFTFIEQHSEVLSQMSDDALEQIVDQYTEKQPYLVVFLIASQEEYLHEAELELLFYLGIQILYIVYQSEAAPPEVNEQLIDEVVMDNDDLGIQLNEESQAGFQRLLEDVMDEHPQGDLIQFAFLAVTEEDEDEDELIFDEENKVSVFMVLKVMIDCLHQVSE